MKILDVNRWTKGFEAALNCYEALIVAAHEKALLRQQSNHGSLANASKPGPVNQETSLVSSSESVKVNATTHLTELGNRWSKPKFIFIL